MLFVVGTLRCTVLASQAALCVGIHVAPARRFCELGVSRPNSAVHERFLHCAPVRHAWAPENSFAGNPSGQHLSGEAVNRHAYYVAYPSKQPSLVVPPKLPDANLAQEGVHGDSSSPGVAKIDAAHGSDAVMVEPLQFHELAFS